MHAILGFFIGLALAPARAPMDLPALSPYAQNQAAENEPHARRETMPPTNLQQLFGNMGQGISISRRQLQGLQSKRQSTNYLYSANKLGTSFAVGDYAYFQVGIGTAGQGYSSGLTPTETNLATGGRLPDQQSWLIREIGFAYAAGTVVADLKLVADNAYLRIEKPQFKEILGPPTFYPAGFGVYSAVTTNATNGVPSQGARMKLRTPILLQPGEQFTFFLACTSAQTLSAATITYLVLFGDTLNEIVD